MDYKKLSDTKLGYDNGSDRLPAPGEFSLKLVNIYEKTDLQNGPRIIVEAEVVGTDKTNTGWEGKPISFTINHLDKFDYGNKELVNLVSSLLQIPANDLERFKSSGEAGDALRGGIEEGLLNGRTWKTRTANKPKKDGSNMTVRWHSCASEKAVIL